MSAAAGLLVVGLGNPGARYAGTRHNVGADAVDLLATRGGSRLRDDRKVSARVGTVSVAGVRLHLAVPTTFMNESGRSVSQLLRRHAVQDWDRLVVIHDELDLEPATIKVKLGGGLAGNNGLRSITEHLHTQDYVRVRIGIGKPRGGAERGADWVLSKVPKSARADLDVAIVEAADAVELIATDGVAAAMQRYNARI